jgi:N-acetylglucosamine kinase-like BadF-type ATPase
MRYFLGVDLGGTKTHVVLADEAGCVVGFAQSGPGNHQSIGYPAMLRTLQQGLGKALAVSGIPVHAISGAGFGIAGYDWPSQKPDMFQVIDQLGLSCPIGIVNDAVPALIAGAAEGWGVALVSGTGCNCRGRDREHKREGRVTGYGFHVGEHAGASELVWRAMHAVAHDWTKRGPATTLSTVCAEYAGAKDLDDLIEGYTEGRYRVDAQAARLIFEIAGQGDVVAQELIRWAGVELGEMANAVIRQLEIEALEFDVVMSGGMFDGGSMMIEPMSETITKVAPGARMVRLAVPPVIGAVILGMEQDELVATPDIRRNLAELLQN